MNFCEDCDDMLYIKIKSSKDETESPESTDAQEETTESNKLIYLCKTCGREYPQDSKSTNCVYHLNYNIDNIKKESLLNEYTFYDPTLPKASGIKCPNTNCPSKTSNIVYLNYDNLNMKYIYICLDCKKADIKPHIW